jgi:hypothetical protein
MLIVPCVNAGAGPAALEIQSQHQGEIVMAFSLALSRVSGALAFVLQRRFSKPGGGAVPEPSTWAMMLLGFATLGRAGYGKRKQAAAGV